MASLNGWEAAVWHVAKDVIDSEIGKYLEDYIKDELGEDWRKVLEIGMNVGGQALQWILAAIGTAAAQLAGFAVAAAAYVGAFIIADIADDYYGVEVRTLVLPTNAAEYINALPGHFTSDGGYQLDTPNGFDMHGHTTWTTATATDGTISIGFHWTMLNKTLG